MHKKITNYRQNLTRWIFSFLLFSLALPFGSAKAQTITSYNDCAAASAGTAISLADGNLLNQDITILGTVSGNTNSILDPNCVVLPASGTSDAWVRFNPIASGSVVFEYTPTTAGRDAALVFYRASTGGACASLQLMRCSDIGSANETESISLNVALDPAFEYFVRIINLNSTADLAGKMTIYGGSRKLGDLCQNAIPVSIGTCNYNFNVEDSFYNNEGKADPTDCTIPVVIDGWLKFEATAGQKIGIEYASIGSVSSTIDGAIAVYDGSCGILTQRACANEITNREVLEYVVVTTGTQYIRIINTENDETLTGNICIYEAFTRNSCTDLTGVSPLSLGDCGIKMNILSSYTSSGVNPNSCVSDNKDAWIPFSISTTTDVLFEYSSVSSSPVDIAVYDMGVSTCTNPTAIACIGNSLGGGSLEFEAVAGRTYYIQVVSRANTPISGTVCVYSADKKAEDNFYTSNVFEFDNSDCGVQFNILSGFNNTGNASISTPTTIPCATVPSQADAWASFVVPDPLPAGLTELTVEYDNDNQEPTDANDVAMLIYRGSPINPPVNSAPANQVAATNPGDATVALSLDTFYGDVSILGSFGSSWIRLDIPTTGIYTLVYQGPLSSEITFDIRANDQSTSLGNINAAQGTFSFTAGTTYYVGIFNQGATDITGAQVGVFSPLTQLACANDLQEGTERITLTGASITPGAYFIRVVNINPNIDIDGDPIPVTTTSGKLCIRDGSVMPDDVCATARQLVVGDCNIEFSLNNADLPFLQPTVIDPTCLGGKTVQTDAWASFNATNTRTTIEYLNLGTTGQDAAIVVYQGTCAGLTPVGTACSSYYRDAIGPVSGLESITFNTVVGNTYYVRILNVGADIDMPGRLCIFNTTERDVCDDNDLVTLVADVCNLRMNVPLSFTNAGVDYLGSTPAALDRNSCGATNIDFDAIGARDSWVRYVGNGNLITIQYENINDPGAPSNPFLLLYTAVQGPGPVDCGTGINGAGNQLNQFACANDVEIVGQQTESLTFQSVAGQAYILRVINLANNEMQGTLCIFSGQKTPDAACSALAIDIRSPTGAAVDVGKCNIQFNVTPDNAGCADPAVAACITPGTCQGVAWAKFTTGVSVATLPADNITVQYDNSTNSAISSVDIGIEIYRQDTDCSDLVLVGCADALTEGFEEVNFNGVTAGQTYFIRIISKSTDRTAFGKLCIFYGESVAREDCATTIDYGQINGVWRSFIVESTWTDTRPQNTIAEPTPCAIPGGSNPVAPDPPIVSNGWTRFTIPPTSTITAVTVQFDNYDFSTDNAENAAVAVYAGRTPSFYTNPNLCSTSNLALIDCANNVWRGTESISVQVQAGQTYFVRVMNVKNAGKDMPGRIRIFPYTECTLGDELVIDGTFVNWGAVTFDGPGDPTILPAAATSWYDMDKWRFQNPAIERYRRNPTGAQLPRHINTYARFATDYGYVEDKNGGQTGQLAANSLNRLRVSSGEFNKEGLYAVSQQGFSRKEGGFSGTDFYGYGHGYTGWGGFKFESYCAAGDPNREEACNGFGTPQTQMPALVPHTADANFMIVTGLWNKNNGSTDPNKVWCQTIDIDAPVRPVRYYVFSVWIQNMVRIGANLDVPQIRVTACDMENPSSPGIINDAGVVIAGSLPSPAFEPTFNSVLPGVTFTPSGLNAASEVRNPDNLTFHFPQPPNNGDILKTAPLGFSFGAAEPCNIPGVEPDNARIKQLGSDLYIPESPDQWLVIRCIYRAPADVRHFNLCIENLALDKNGNDFGIDDISIKQCLNPDIDALDNLLRGDACELNTNVSPLGVPLNERLLDFTGKLIGDKVALDWLAIGDANTLYYEVQRSSNATEFSTIGRVDGKGATQNLNNYHFTDSELPTRSSVIYYRLRSVDRDGNVDLSDAIRVNIEELTQLTLNLYPNPSKNGDEVNLEFQAAATKAQVMITDLMGTQITTQYFDTVEGANKITIRTDGLSAGIYIINLNLGGRRTAKKLVITD